MYVRHYRTIARIRNLAKKLSASNEEVVMLVKFSAASTDCSLYVTINKDIEENIKYNINRMEVN